ncbi:glycosyltransferase, partial [Escherichia coli]|nr:glycosyltransferase [Escherichia coli]
MMRKFYVFESICSEVFHSQFNSAYLSALEGDIVFSSTERHWFYIKKKLKKNIQWKKESQRKKTILSNVLWALKNSKFMAKKAELIFLSSDIFIFYRCIILKLLGFENIKYVTHADLENIKNPRKIKDYVLFFRRHYFLMRLLDAMDIKIVLLSRVIYNNLCEYIKIKNYEIIEHPYLYDEVFTKKKYERENIKIAFLGLPTKEKGFFWLYNELKKNNKIKNCQFYLLGKCENVNYARDRFVFSFEYLDEITDDDIKKELSRMDYVIFPFAEEQYKLRASGTVFDALNARKPILVTNNLFIRDVMG